MWEDFDPQPYLEGDAVLLRPLEPHDLDDLYAAARDPRIWAGHPAKTRHERRVFDPSFAFLLKKQTALAIVDCATAQIIGTSSYYAAPDRPNDISIGFTFLATAYWGGETNFAVKSLMLEHIFKHRDEAWFHIDPSNLRSQKATEKLGAVLTYEARLALGPSPADWLCYRLTHATWQKAGLTRNQHP